MIEVSKKIVMKPISEVKPYIRNPRKNEKTVKLLVDIIPKVGFNVPLVIDKNGIIVKGHARYAAAIQLGMDSVPCVVTEADEEAIKLDRIADNKISEFSEWVTDELLHELDALNIDFDLEELGLPSVSFDDIPEPDFDELSGGEDPERAEKYRKFLEEQKAKEEARLENAVKRAEDQATPEAVAEKNKQTQKYWKVVCPDCGKVIFVKEGDAVWEIQEEDS
jgi:ParB-like chromosome segregation protein Spo0J